MAGAAPAHAGIPCITDCVMAELEKLGPKYRLALRLAKDPRFHRIPCAHKGTYADDCIVERITAVRVLLLSVFVPHPVTTVRMLVQHQCYIVATCDKDLKRRIRKVWALLHARRACCRMLTCALPCAPQVPGVPIMYIQARKFTIERMPEAFGAPKV